MPRKKVQGAPEPTPMLAAEAAAPRKVGLYLSRRLYQELRIQAIRREMTVSRLISDILYAWLETRRGRKREGSSWRQRGAKSLPSAVIPSYLEWSSPGALCDAGL